MSDGLKLLRAVVDQGATETLREISEELLVGAEEVAVYQFISRHYRAYAGMPTPATVTEETNVRLPAVNEVAQFYMDRCHNRRLFNEVRGPFNQLRTALMSQDAELSRSSIVELATHARVTNPGQDLLTISELGEEVWRHYTINEATADLIGAPTGWPTLDEETGGWQSGDLILFVARPGHGKTALLVHSARMAWMGGRRVLFVSMEMTLRQIGYRFYAMHAGVDPDAFRKGQLSRFGRRRMEQAMQEIDGDNRFHLYAGNFRGKRASEVATLIQELNPDIVFIDGLYLMSPTDAPRYTGRYEKVAYVADEVKRIALEHSRPIVATVQFNREAGKSGASGGLEQLAGSDALSQHGSVIIGIKNPPGVDDPRPRHRVLEVLKGREGEQGQIAINFNFVPVDFSECSEEETKELLEQNEVDYRNGVTNMDEMA